MCTTDDRHTFMKILIDAGIVPALIETCSEVTSAQKILYLKNFKTWSLKHHPDKGGNSTTFAIVSNCVDIILKSDQAYTLNNHSNGVSHEITARNDRFWFTVDPRKLHDLHHLLSKYISLQIVMKKDDPVLGNLRVGIIMELNGDGLKILSYHQYIHIPYEEIETLTLIYPNKEAGMNIVKAFKCPEGKVYNPKSGRYVKRDGKIGRKILETLDTPQKYYEI